MDDWRGVLEEVDVSDEWDGDGDGAGEAAGEVWVVEEYRG